MSLAQRIHVFWDGLALRERGLIVFGLAVVLPVAVYLYLWQPANVERARLAVRVQQLRGELAQLRADGEEVQRLRAQVPASTGETLETLARQSAARFGLPDVKVGLSTQGKDRLQVDLASVDFDAWVRWLGELGVHGISLAACQVDALPTPGLVRVKATLSRAAS